MTRSLLVVPLALLCLAAPAQAQVSSGFLVHKGQRRTYRVYRPRRALAGPRPVVIALHGHGQDGAKLMRLLGTNQLAERDGVVVVYPDGLNEAWNDGRGVDQSGSTEITKVDDIGFVSRLIERAVTRWGGDRSKVSVCGVSNGALMTYRVGIELSDKITAAAGFVGSLPEALASARVARPLPMLIMNGTADPILPYKGGTSPYFGPQAGRVLSTEATAEFWARNNGGLVRVQRELLPDTDPRDRSRVKRIRYQTRSGVPVVLYEVEGGGHTIPGTKSFGRVNGDIDGVEVVWDFLVSEGRRIASAPAASSALLTSSVTVKGQRRTFSYRLPQGRRPLQPAPALIVLHGGARGVGRDIARATGYPALADREGFVAVFPDGVDGQWNDGRGISLRDGVDVTRFDDVGFLRKIIDASLPHLNVDPRRIYLVGISNGGMLAHRAGIEIGDRLAAAAAVISNLPGRLASERPVASLPFLIMNGSEDRWAPYGGGQARKLGQPVGNLLSTRETVAFWARANGGATRSVSRDLPERDARDGTRVSLQLTTCRKAPVALYTIHGGGHYFPGGAGMPELRRLFGVLSREIAGPQVVWTWLSRFQRS